MGQVGLVRVLLVDDEPLARDSLRHLLLPDEEVLIVGECGHGIEAVAAIDELSSDLVFLDVQMPEVDGFGVLERLPPHLDPEIVFVTAYDQHALRAFEVHALDYLVKPVARARFAEALAHAKERLRQRRAQAVPSGVSSWQVLVDGAKSPDGYVTRLAVRGGGRHRFVWTHEVDWIEAADYYTRLHVGPRDYLIRRSMRSLERALDPDQFLRIHRGAIVQADRVVELRHLEHGAHAVVLRDDTELRISRGRRKVFEILLRGRP